MFGVLAIDKPADWTSRDVVNRIQRIVRPDKAGHTGTLDPMATGVLLVAVGPATRLVEFSHASPKSYTAEFQLGRSSDTLDIRGKVETLSDASEVSESGWRAEMQRWRGEIQQTPPKFSAVHIDGRRAYDLARSGQEFQVPSRTVCIHHLSLRAFEYPNLRLDITCSSGTYIRSLGSDIARALGSNAIMTRLVRTRIGSVELDDCFDLQQLATTSDVATRLMSPANLVECLPSCVLGEAACKKIRNGIPLKHSEFAEPIKAHSSLEPQASCKSLSDSRSVIAEEQPIAAFDAEQNLVAILARRGGRYRSLRVFHKTNATVQPSKIRMPQRPES